MNYSWSNNSSEIIYQLKCNLTFNSVSLVPSLTLISGSTRSALIASSLALELVTVLWEVNLTALTIKNLLKLSYKKEGEDGAV